MKKVGIGLVQMAMSEKPEENLRKALSLARRAAGRGARIICLPELYRSRYFPQARRAHGADALAEPAAGPSARAFKDFAREHQAVLIVPIFERAAGDRRYNTALVIDADGRELEPPYRKTHIPQDPRFYEKDYFLPGDRGFLVHKTRYAALSVLICYDQWFPEAARACVLKGADILFYPTAIGTAGGAVPREGDWRRAWIDVQRGHAIANGVHVAAVNRVGKEGALRFFGSSFVSDSFGRVFALGGRRAEGAVVCFADLSLNRHVREGWGFLKNREPRRYGELCR